VSGADTLAAETRFGAWHAWDEALEPYRDGGDTAEVSWLTAEWASFSGEDLSAPGTADTSTGTGTRIRVGVGVDAGGVHGDRAGRARAHLVRGRRRALEHGGEQPDQLVRDAEAPS